MGGLAQGSVFAQMLRFVYEVCFSCVGIKAPDSVGILLFCLVCPNVFISRSLDRFPPTLPSGFFVVGELLRKWLLYAHNMVSRL